MSLAQLGTLLWSGKWRLLLCALASLAGTLAISSRLPKSYEAKARVILELMQPDPVNGVAYGTKNTEAYVRTQQLLATGERVGQLAIEKLGWTANPEVIASWQEQTGGVGDIKAWAANRLLGDVQAYPLEGGGTLEIAYRAPDPAAAAVIVRTLREAYIETTLALQTEAATRRANRFAALLKPAQASFDEAQAKLNIVLRQTGTVFDAKGEDIQNAALGRIESSGLAQRTAAMRDSVGIERRMNSGAVLALRGDLVKVEQEIALAGNNLGSDNPTYRALLDRRALLVGQIGQAQAAARGAAAAAAGAANQLSARAENDYLAERERVLDRTVTSLPVVQAQRLVALRAGEVNRLRNNLAEAQQSAERTESGLVVMGDVITNMEPVSPDIPLNALLATLFGLGLGFVSVMIDGLWRREVLGATDLAKAAGVPVLAVLHSSRRAWYRRLFDRRRPAAA